MYHPISNDRNREFVELYNRSDAPVDLTGWEFTNGVEFSFPDNTVIEPGGYLVVGGTLSCSGRSTAWKRVRCLGRLTRRPSMISAA